ncbi:hypothetical protein JSQ81_18345 [Sporosarcina sp. Marseille-Q4063]|uniref:hypothetical protein n=1 Tax=Sporosarcina sp. Marseille-Q4063 TaxID=2810514 RepID=UPI001BB0CC93|nr:hypothetical protein [Sporosarcina sp. Marseille-Q4063]QUW21715.1 hypothetical protein JSQ81_18345 [Sporosarcina sp. Marseille-Q4063]
MDQRQIDDISFRLKNVESFILELILLTYPLLLISENLLLSPHYLLIAVAISIGIACYLFFQIKPYSILMGLFFSLLLTTPFYFINLPVPLTVFIFMYTSWRMHANFGLQRNSRWNFLAINTIVFTIFYFITRSYLLKAHATEINKVNVLLFLLTTILFIVLRYITILILGRRLPKFEWLETSKVFAAILGVGIATYLLIYYLIEPIRTAVLAVLGFLFGGLFMFVSTAITPFIDYVIDWLDYLRWKKYQEMEKPTIYNTDNDMDGKLEIFSSRAELNIGVYVVIGAAILAAIVLYLNFRQKRHMYDESKGPAYKVRLFGRGDKKKSDVEQVYDYSIASNAVRTAYQSFENDAHQAKHPRFAGETVKEWFSRMGWRNNENLFATYDKARYGAMTLTEEEGRRFEDDLNEIRDKYFTNRR